MKQTLAYLENGHFTYETKIADDLRAAIQQEEQQPVPVKTYSGGKAWPVQTEWVGLKDDEVGLIVNAHTTDDHGFDFWCDGRGVARAVETKLKEKNAKG